MTTNFRRIAIYVDETAHGLFRWVLIEQVKQTTDWNPIHEDRKSFRSYREAMAAGLMALQTTIDDLDRGPREVAAAEPSKRAGSHFGFGDLPG